METQSECIPAFPQVSLTFSIQPSNGEAYGETAWRAMQNLEEMNTTPHRLATVTHKFKFELQSE